MWCRTLALSLSLGLAPAGVLRAQHDATQRAPDAPDTTEARRAIRALEQEWLDSSDSVTLDRILADDFLHVVGLGEVITKAEHIAWAVRHPRPKNRHTRFENLVVRIYGSAAVATGTVVVTDDATHTASRDSFTDVFALRHHRWQAVSAQESEAATTPRALNERRYSPSLQ